MGELGHVGGREREAVEEGPTLCVGGIGVVHREHDAVDAERQQRGEKRRLGEDAAGREPDLVGDGAADGPLEVRDVARENLVEAGHHHRQHLAHVTDDELEAGMAVERAGEHHAEHVDSGFRMPAPAGCLEHAARARLQIGVIGLPHCLRRKVRVDVDRHVEVHGRREQAFIARVIEEAAFGRAVDERADEAQLLHGAHELAGGGIRALHRQDGEPGEAIWMAGNGGRQMVVHLAGDGDAFVAGHEIGAGAGVGQHLHRDAGLVHRPQTPLADLGRPAPWDWGRWAGPFSAGSRAGLSRPDRCGEPGPEP